PPDRHATSIRTFVMEARTAIARVSPSQSQVAVEGSRQLHRIRPTFTLMMLMLTALPLLAAPGIGSSILAQATIACEPATSAEPAATPARVAAPDAAFPDSGELTVFAAASLTDAFTELGDAIMVAYPGITIAFNFSGSQALATQLAQGAPADVF